MGAHRMSVHVESAGAASEAQVERVFDLVLSAPFGTYERMRRFVGASESKHEPLDASAARAHLRAPHAGVVFSAEPAAGPFEVWVTRRPELMVTYAVIDRDGFLDDGGEQAMARFLRDASDRMDGKVVGTAGAAVDLPGLYRTLGLGKVAPCFKMFLRWRHVVSEAALVRFHHREDVLAAPVWSLETWVPDRIGFQVFEHPLDQFDSPEAHRRIVELTHYLRACRKPPPRRPR